MKFRIDFHDEVDADSEDEAIEEFVQYLRECVKHGDVTAFEFQQMPDGTLNKSRNRRNRVIAHA